jgi:hypothetical protein
MLTQEGAAISEVLNRRREWVPSRTAPVALKLQRSQVPETNRHFRAFFFIKREQWRGHSR